MEAKDGKGQTPLQLCANHEDSVMAERLLLAGASLSQPNWLGWTVLHSAASNLKFTELCIFYGADVNAAARSGETPLHCAAAFGNEQAARFLVKHGANTQAKTVEGFIAREKAEMHGFENIANFLILHDAATKPRTAPSRKPVEKSPSLKAEQQLCLQDHIGEVWGVCFSCDGKCLATWCSDGFLLIYETEDFTRLHTLGPEQAPIARAHWSSDDSKILTCGPGYFVRVWDVAVCYCAESPPN